MLNYIVSILLILVGLSLFSGICVPSSTIVPSTLTPSPPLSESVPTTVIQETQSILPVSPEVPDESLPITPSPTSVKQVKSAASNTSTPITGRLILTKIPLLNEKTILTFIFSSTIATSNTHSTITLPQGAILLDGTLEWQGNLEPNQNQFLQVKIMFVEEGNWTLKGNVLNPFESGDIWGDAAHIYLYVAEDRSHIGFSNTTPTQSVNEGVPPPPSIDPIP